MINLTLFILDLMYLEVLLKQALSQSRYLPNSSAKNFKYSLSFSMVYFGASINNILHLNQVMTFLLDICPSDNNGCCLLQITHYEV
jgi:hypothetical protein